MLQGSLQAAIELNKVQVATDFRPELAKLDLPTLVIHGDKDASAPLEINGRPTAAAIRGARLKVYEGGLWAAPSIQFQSPEAICEIRPTTTDDRARQLGASRCASFPGDCDVGSANLAAAAGLAAALSWGRGQAEGLYRGARVLAARLREALGVQPGCRVFGGQGTPHTAALSLLIDGLPLAAAEAHFAERGITLRAGQHCAPFALRAIGAPEGTLRVSFGPFNRASDVDAIVAAVADATGGPG